MTLSQIAVLTSFLLAVGGALPLSAETRKDIAVAGGLKITVEYTITGPDKDVLNSNVGKEPLSYVQGVDQVFPPALDKALLGMKVGDKKHVDLLAEQAFGLYDPSKKITVDRKNVPQETKVGTVLTSRGGGPPLRVVEMTEKSVVLDGNHPMAGKNLGFDIKILSVERAP
jgi:FKBP-type peptidyl-prolyl cis-trans isomerase 2